MTLLGFWMTHWYCCLLGRCVYISVLATLLSIFLLMQSIMLLALLPVFHHPATVYFSVCVPNLDVIDDDETRLHRTAATQVFAPTLQALRERPPPESRHDEAERLDTWAVQYDDILRNIPATERKRKEPRASPYKPQRWKGFKRSPVDTNIGPPEDDEDDPLSPTPNLSRADEKAVSLTGTGSRDGGGKRRQRRGEQQEQGQATKPNIQSRPFRTQQCLLGLAYGGPTMASTLGSTKLTCFNSRWSSALRVQW
ncbi:hypothetical protein K469DRAFT_52759 [Zopfia rhizophila CBS 207.26]|uniref:Uncharacterized protein n=1 Tax=Zopfia rhizophila CBS 207.26 TaxID=1314779 RepID=A0A6A6D8J9_9PEZI|nr:hypothetical protein K469DRAFT_52759 [Zopfia rhizophila CBS 207.26]